MIELAVFLKGAGYRPRQVQDFIPAPMDLATSVFYTGLDPHTMKPVPVATKLKDRRMQRALMQFFKDENWFEVRQALKQSGRDDLVGSGPQCLIKDSPPAAALAARSQRRGRELDRYVHEEDALGPTRLPAAGSPSGTGRHEPGNGKATGKRQRKRHTGRGRRERT
jgi:hypothetical protein